MLCLTCGAILQDPAKFCSDCGSPAPFACLACGHLNPSKANFCRECGARRAEDAADLAAGTAFRPHGLPTQQASGPRAERRQLTVLFCDLVGSTALSARLDPEDLRDVIGAYHRCVAESVGRFDGFVARYMGDGALVYFGYPRAHEDNAERALRAALTLASNIAKLEVHQERLCARIGIATGLVVVGELVNVDAAKEETALGETPNLAARLQAIAEPGTILIADNTRRLISGAFAYRDLGAVTLKDFKDPIRVWQVIGDERVQTRVAAFDSQRAPYNASAGTGATTLVGRERELALLRNHWELVCAGQGRTALLTGDAGIGKSRLMQALVSSIHHEPHYELEFHCSAYHLNSPLYPVVNLLPGVVGLSRDDADSIRFAKLETFCSEHQLSTAEALPLLASLLSIGASPRFPMPPMGPERQKQRTLQTLVDVALSFAAERPMLMVVEDLQWIDPTTMEIIELLIDLVPTVRVFAIFTARLPFQPHWASDAHVAPIMLTRFTRGETEAMVERIAAGRPLPADVVKQIVAKTDGIPLFIEELTKTVLESHGTAPPAAASAPAASAPPPVTIPATLQDSLMARLDRLGSGKAVAQLGAALGREFAYSTLRAVCTLDESTLQLELSRLVDAEFLYQRGAPPEASYIFKHALIQEAAYQSLLRSTRQRYHERIAQVIVDQFSNDAQTHPEFTAMHYTEAADFDAAVRWWQKAGQHAFRRASYAEAINHYTKGLDVLHSLPHSDDRDQSELELQVELGYAVIPLKGWVASQSAQAFTRAGELCQRVGDAPKLFRALWGLGAFHFVRGDQRHARQVADQGLSVARQAADIDALLEARYLSGIVSCAMGDFVSGRVDLQECIRLYGADLRVQHQVLYGQDAKASALGWLAMGLCTLGYPDAALEHAKEALAWVRNTTQPFLLARSLAGVGFVHIFRGEPQEAESPLKAAIALCGEQNFAYFHAVTSVFHGAALASLGETDQGIALMRSSIDKLRAIGSELLFTVILGNLASAHLALGQVDEGVAAIAEGLRCVEANGEHWGESELYRIHGQLHLARGSHAVAQAEACFTKALELSAQQHANAYRLRAATSLARLWQQQAKGARAKALLSEAISFWPETVDTADLRDARTLEQQLADYGLPM